MSMTRAAQRGSASARRPLVAAPVSPLGRLGSWSYRHRRLVAVAWLAGPRRCQRGGAARRVRVQGQPERRDQHPVTAGRRVPAAQLPEPGGRCRAGGVRDRGAGHLGRRPGPDHRHAGRAGRAAARGVGAQPVRGRARPRQVSPDGHIAYGVVRFDGSGDALPDAAIQRVITQAQRGGRPRFRRATRRGAGQKVEKPQFGKSEALGILAAVLILLLAFGSVIAMVLPIATAIAAVADLVRPA